MTKVVNWLQKLSTKQKIFFSVFLALIFLLPLSKVVPPMQSPDEIAHTIRAYSLFDGEILPDKDVNGNRHLKSNKSLVDINNLLSPMYHNFNVKDSNDTREKLKSIKMTSEQDLFRVASGYYFPLIYLPHSIGLYVGELLNLSAYTSYMLARFLAMLASLLIFAYAFTLVKPNFLTIIMLLVPMYLFQIVSASLDGIATAGAVLAISLFIKIMKNDTVNWWYFSLLSLSIFLITTSRLNLIPLLLFLFVISFFKRNALALIVSIVTSILSLGWNLFAVFFTPPIKASTVSFADKIIYYLTSPIEFLILIVNTTIQSTSFYIKSFIGVLGYLDIRLHTQYYIFAFIILLLIIYFTFRNNAPIKQLSIKYVLRFVSIISILLIFATLLVQWTDEFPAKIIIGIQGRYFLIPFLIFSYSLGDISGIFQHRKRFNFIIILIAIFFIVGYYDMMSRLIERYYIAGTPILQILFG